jgi:hypothetical protein
MADNAALAHRLMLVHERTTLLRMAFEAGFISAEERESAGVKPLLHVCRGTLGRYPFVRFMTIAATHFAFEHRMMMRQRECCADFQVTLKTGVRRFSRVDNCALSAASLNVQAPGTVARFAAHVLGVFPFCLQSRVSSRSEVAHDLFVTGGAFL